MRSSNCSISLGGLSEVKRSCLPFSFNSLMVCEEIPLGFVLLFLPLSLVNIVDHEEYQFFQSIFFEIPSFC